MFYTFNYLVDFSIWVLVGYGLYKFWKPSWQKRAWRWLIKGLTLAILMTVATVIITDRHPMFLEHLPSRSWWRISTQYSNKILLLEQPGIDTAIGTGSGELWNGWPIGYVHRKWCGQDKKTKWEIVNCAVTINVFKSESATQLKTLYFLEPQALLFDLIFWSIISLCFLRIRYSKNLSSN